MSRPKIALLSPNSKFSCLVKKELPDSDITSCTPTASDPLNEEQIRSLVDTEILLIGFRAAHVISELPKLKWIQIEFAGTDNVLEVMRQLPQKVRGGITVTRNGESFARPVSEYVLSQILAVSHDHPRWHDQQKEGIYKKDGFHTWPLSVSSVAILGLGSIGKEVARMCKCFGMKVWGMTRSEVRETNKSPDVDEYRLTSGLPELLSECDYIVNILPSTEETRGLLSGDVFSHCKSKKAVFINVGRGEVTDEASLLKALRKALPPFYEVILALRRRKGYNLSLAYDSRSAKIALETGPYGPVSKTIFELQPANRWLQHAVLDVHSPEPLPVDSPLWREPGVIITPHIAYGGPATLQDRVDMFVKQYHRYVNKEPLKYVIDIDRGY